MAPCSRDGFQAVSLVPRGRRAFVRLIWKMMTPKKSGNPIAKHVGKRVRMRRMMLGMSQAKLGDALGITFQQVQKYEKGTNRISAGRLQHISETFQVPVEFFFEGAPHPRGQHSAQTDAPSPQFVSDYLATPDGHKLTK